MEKDTSCINSPYKTECALCKLSSVRTATRGQNTYYAIECTKYGLLANNYTELLEDVKTYIEEERI